MGFTYFGKKSGLSRAKDWIIFAVCAFLYLIFFCFLLSSDGIAFFDFIKKCMPFIELIDGTLSDINRLFSLFFERFGLDAPMTSIITEASGITVQGLFLDLSKLMLSSFFQSIIFLAFSFLFLHAKDFGLVSTLLGGEKTDILYYINSALLMGISILVGGLTGNAIIHFVSKPILGLETKLQIWISLLLFIVLYVLFSIYFMLRSRKSLGGAFSFRRSLLKTIVFNVIPEALVFFLTNIISVLMFNSFTQLGFHIFSLFTLFLFILWAALYNIITGTLQTLFVMNIPFCGKRCPISGIFWLPATATFLSLLYIMMVPNMDPSTYTLVDAPLSILPFLAEWVQGMPVFSIILENLQAYKTDLLNLFVMCTLVALLQYLSSSYTATLFTQVILRWLLMGVGFLIIIVCYMFLTLVCKPMADGIEYKSIAIIVAVICYIFFVIYQPYLALQGILSTVLILLMMQWFPGTRIAVYNGTDAAFGSYIGVALIMIGTNLLLSLVQNIVAVCEKTVHH